MREYSKMTEEFRVEMLAFFGKLKVLEKDLSDQLECTRHSIRSLTSTMRSFEITKESGRPLIVVPKMSMNPEPASQPAGQTPDPGEILQAEIERTVEEIRSEADKAVGT